MQYAIFSQLPSTLADLWMPLSHCSWRLRLLPSERPYSGRSPWRVNAWAADQGAATWEGPPTSPTDPEQLTWSQPSPEAADFSHGYITDIILAYMHGISSSSSISFRCVLLCMYHWCKLVCKDDHPGRNCLLCVNICALMVARSCQCSRKLAGTNLNQTWMMNISSPSVHKDDLYNASFLPYLCHPRLA